MSNKLLLIVLFFVIIYLQVRSKEFFFNINNKKDNCAVTTNILNDVNHYMSEACTKDDSFPNNDINNNRLNCRQFEENNIFLSKDRESWCEDLKKIPELKEKTTDPNEIFDGIDELQNYDIQPKPVMPQDQDQRKFPFNDAEINFIDLDNKND